MAYAVLMEAEKFYYLHLASWRPRRAHHKITVSLNLKAEDQCPGSSTLGQRINYPLSILFCSIQATSGLDTTHPHREGQPALLSLLTKMLILSRNTLTDILKSNV